MKKYCLILSFLILLVLLLTSCQGRDSVQSINFLEAKDNKLADSCIDNLCNRIKNEDEEAVKNMFSNKACSDTANIDFQIDKLFEFIDGEVLSWKREESPIVEDCTELGKTSKHEMFWFSLKTSKDIYSVFLSYYPIESINPNNKGIYSMLIIRKCDENGLEGSINEWSTVPGITIR